MSLQILNVKRLKRGANLDIQTLDAIRLQKLFKSFKTKKNCWRWISSVCSKINLWRVVEDHSILWADIDLCICEKI